MSLPTADDLFRPTAPPAPPQEPVPDSVQGPGEDSGEPADGDAAPGRGRAKKKPSGRVRHDEKMTVYVTSDELLDLEHARLVLRRTHGLAVDRGRLVREAIAMVLADFEAHGDESALVRRLTEE